MVVSVKAAARAEYYFQANGLEAHGEYAAGRWHGSASNLGVADGSPVAKGDFERLLGRQTIWGESPVFGRKSASTGRDFVFSAPKSVSILWAFAGKDLKREIEAAHIAAVEAAAKILLSEACRERRGKGGTALHPALGVAAHFLHVASRRAQHAPRAKLAGDELLFPDPNLHSHLVMPDLVESLAVRPGSPLKIGYTAMHGYWSMALGAWYHATLAFHLRASGFAPSPASGNGLFQIGGIPAEWVAAFSARTTGLNLPGHPLSNADPSPAEKSRALAATRKPAVRIHAPDLQKSWQGYAIALGMGNLPVPLAAPPAGPGGDRLAQLEKDSISDAGAHEAVLQKQDLCRAFAARIVADGLHLLPTMAAVEALVGNKDLLEPLEPSRSYGFQQWTAKANAKDERKIEGLVHLLVRAAAPPVPLAPNATADLAKLNNDQRAGVAAILSGQRLVVVNGAPGTGKTTLLGPAIRSIEAAHGAGSVIGAAEAWQPALALRRDFGIAAFSLAQIFKGGDDVKRVVCPGTTLIVDEAGLLPTRRMKQVLKLAADTGASLVLVGDEGQLNPIGAGSGLRLVQAFVSANSLSAIVRQDAQTRPIVEGLVALRAAAPGQDSAAEKPMEAARKLADVFMRQQKWTSRATAAEAVGDIVQWMDKTKHESGPTGQSVLALARSNREVQHITRLLRVRLRHQGVLTGEDLAVTGVTPMGITSRLRLAVGERIRFMVRHRGLGVFNGTCATIEAIDLRPAGPRLSVLIDAPGGGRKANFPLSYFHDGKKRVRIAPGYMSTVYGCQGMTADHVVLLKSANMGFRELYVAATRAKMSCSVFEVNPLRAFLAADTGTFPAAASHIARELVGLARRDRPKALARDHRAIPNSQPDRKGSWLWDVMVDGECAPFQPLSNV